MPTGELDWLLCPAGYYCTNDKATFKRCPEGYFCPAGTTENHLEKQQCASIQKHLNTYVLGNEVPDEQEQTLWLGLFCEEGSGDQIPPLFCPAGFFCENASSKVECGEGMFCPLGSHSPIKCAYHLPGFEWLQDCPENSARPGMEWLSLIVVTGVMLMLWGTSGVCGAYALLFGSLARHQGPKGGS
jgi:hypothetical protein